MSDRWENSERIASAACGFEGGKAKEPVQFVNSVNQEEGWASLVVGDIIVDSAADESCWPVGQGDAFSTKGSRKKMLLRTANGGDMQHYGEKEVTFKYDGGENKDPIGLKFQVTDVRLVLVGPAHRLAGASRAAFPASEGKSTRVARPRRRTCSRPQ